MKRIAVLLMLAALSLAAQDNKNTQTKPPAVTVEKLFVLKYADPGQVMNLVRALGGSADQNTQMRAIAVTADKTAMAVIEDAVKQLDTPAAAPKNIELTVYLILGTDAENSTGNPVPKELESVVTQLKGAFPFKNYRQVDLIEMRTRTGERAYTRSEGAVVSKDPQPVAPSTRLQDPCTPHWRKMDRRCGWTAWRRPSFGPACQQPLEPQRERGRERRPESGGRAHWRVARPGPVRGADRPCGAVGPLRSDR